MTTNELIGVIRTNHNNHDCLAQIASAVEAMKEELPTSEDHTFFAMIEFSELDSPDRDFLKRSATDHLKRFGDGQQISSADISRVILSWFNQLRDFKRVISWLEEECQ